MGWGKLVVSPVISNTFTIYFSGSEQDKKLS